uniref:Uncharacterized protein n=1 Tax=Peronospora matthiolae TaxID=2874970 RepID=A0AAV1UL69_9STRA
MRLHVRNHCQPSIYQLAAGILATPAPAPALFPDRSGCGTSAIIASRRSISWQQGSWRPPPPRQLSSQIGADAAARPQSLPAVDLSAGSRDPGDPRPRASSLPRSEQMRLHVRNHCQPSIYQLAAGILATPLSQLSSHRSRCSTSAIIASRHRRKLPAETLLINQ